MCENVVGFVFLLCLLRFTKLQPVVLSACIMKDIGESPVMTINRNLIIVIVYILLFSHSLHQCCLWVFAFIFFMHVAVTM